MEPIARDESPEARASHAGNVIDRVLEIEQHLKVARTAMHDVVVTYELAHDGPVKPLTTGCSRASVCCDASPATLHSPVVDGMLYRRAGSEGLLAVALDHSDAGCSDDALVALLTDQDHGWSGPAIGSDWRARGGADRLCLLARTALGAAGWRSR